MTILLIKKSLFTPEQRLKEKIALSFFQPFRLEIVEKLHCNTLIG